MKLVIDKRYYTKDLIIINCYIAPYGILAGQFNHLDYELDSYNSEIL